MFFNGRNWLTLTTTPVADNTSSEVGHGESWPENPWQTVKKKQYKVQCYTDWIQEIQHRWILKFDTQVFLSSSIQKLNLCYKSELYTYSLDCPPKISFGEVCDVGVVRWEGEFLRQRSVVPAAMQTTTSRCVHLASGSIHLSALAGFPLSSVTATRGRSSRVIMSQEKEFLLISSPSFK